MQELITLSETLYSLVAQFKEEQEKHLGGNASAGGRTRKIIGDIKNLCTPYRKASVEYDKTNKADKKKKK